MRKIYIMGSLRNPRIPIIANRFEKEGHDVFADWFASGPETDDYWKTYEESRGRTYFQALKGKAAKNTFEFDKKWLDWADTVVMVLPAGRSAHMEFGRAVGQGKPAYVLFDEEPVDRWDVMYQFATDVYDDLEVLVEELSE